METKTDDLNVAMTAELKPPHACIFLQHPFADCYCMNITSSNIRKMLAFCTGEYRSCLVYCRRMAGNPAVVGDR